MSFPGLLGGGPSSTQGHPQQICPQAEQIPDQSKWLQMLEESIVLSRVLSETLDQKSPISGPSSVHPSCHRCQEAPQSLTVGSRAEAQEYTSGLGTASRSGQLSRRLELLCAGSWATGQPLREAI